MTTKQKPKWTGSIIQREYAKRPKSTDRKKYVRELADAILTKGTLAKSIAWQKTYYADILRPFVQQSDNGDTLLDFGNGWKPYKVTIPAGDHVGFVLDAVQGMDVLIVLESLIAKRRLTPSDEKLIQCAAKCCVAWAWTSTLATLEGLANLGFDADAGRRIPKGKLTPDELGQAKISFARQKGDGATDNAAAKAIRKAINSRRQRVEAVSLSTVQRAVGIKN